MANNQLTIRDYMSAPQVHKKLSEMFTDKRLLDGFVQSVISIAGSDELLAVAEPRSVFNACLTAASLNLPINKNLGFAHIIGYRNNKKNIVEAQFQLGARGFKELAQRSGQYQIINQGDVRKGELVGRDRLTGELKFNWIDNDAEREEVEVVGYFSYFKLKNGFNSTLYMSKDEIIAHGKRYSQSFKRGYGPWTDNFDAMALKTVSKLNISKNGPLSIELQKAVEVDQAVINGEGKVDYIDGEDLASVRAADDKMADIIAANAVVPENVDAGTGEIIEPPAPAAAPMKNDGAQWTRETAEPKADQRPMPAPKGKTVKEMAKERGWTTDKKPATDTEETSNDSDS